MAKINKNYANVKESYLFSDISKRVNDFVTKNPDKKIIRLGIGDVTQPLVSEVIGAMHSAVDDMSVKETFHGYGPEQGYNFVKEKIVDYYKSFNVNIDKNEVFISDGAKSDLGNITDIFSNDNTIVVPDPVYPVYVDSNLMLGRKIIYIDGDASNNFLPMPSAEMEGDIFYLCSPNNPTGSCYNYEQLKIWVDFVNERDGIIIFDAAYECFVTEDLPRSIYEIDGAKTCAIEFCSLSKTAGFTGTRCGYTIVPFDLVRENMKLNKMWLRRQTTKFNGVSYVVQKGAEAVFTEKGQKDVKQVIKYYQNNAKVMANTLEELGIWYTGGVNSPYIWLKCPLNMSSWQFFDYLLNEANIVGTPGSGFGKCGEGYFRLTAFNTLENTIEAMKRLKKLLAK